MSKPIVELEVRDVELNEMLKVLFYNDCDYVIVHRNTDARVIYRIEAHKGEEK